MLLVLLHRQLAPSLRSVFHTAYPSRVPTSSNILTRRSPRQQKTDVDQEYHSNDEAVVTPRAAASPCGWVTFEAKVDTSTLAGLATRISERRVGH